MKKNGVDASNFDVVEGANGQHTFRLLAQNGQVIGRGEMYASKSGALRGADTVRDSSAGWRGRAPRPTPS